MARNERTQDRSGYLSQDTIAAFCTPLGGAISVLRVSGPRSFEVLSQLLPDGWLDKHPEPRKTHRVLLRDLEGSTLDDAVVVRFQNPHSFTGEDSVEISLHGSPVVAERVFETLTMLGVRQALPGEFAFRSVRNGKSTLAQAEAIADLIASTNASAAALALEKMSGAQNRLIESVAERLRGIAVLSEAGIDFSDQDLEELSLPRLKVQLLPIATELRALRDGYGRGSKIQDGIRVALVGLPNAGKSSFFNALLGEDRSIVSAIAGTTRDVVREHLTLRGRQASITLRLEDTAGLRVTDDPIEGMGIERTLSSARSADLVLLIIDGSLNHGERLASRKELSAQWEALGRPSQKTVGIVTKSDLSSTRSDLSAEFIEFGIERWCLTSAMTHDGIHEASETIIEFCGSWVYRDPGEVLLTRMDHLRAVEASLTDLDRASASSELDLFAADLRQTLRSLAPLIGETLPDDILGRIFSGFCIGK